MEAQRILTQAFLLLIIPGTLLAQNSLEVTSSGIEITGDTFVNDGDVTVADSVTGNTTIYSANGITTDRDSTFSVFSNIGTGGLKFQGSTSNPGLIELNNSSFVKIYSSLSRVDVTGVQVRLESVGASGTSGDTLLKGAAIVKLDAPTIIYDDQRNYDCLATTNSGIVYDGCTSTMNIKSDVRDYATGLEAVKRLRPVKYESKITGNQDLGFIAEEVEAIDPLLTYNDSDGHVKGIRYMKLATILVNATKEQQALIDELRERLAKLEQVKK